MDTQINKTKEPSNVPQSQVMNKYTYKHYYTINKEEDKYYLLIRFDCTSRHLTIENTKEFDGNKDMIIIMIIIIVFAAFFVVVMVIIIIFTINHEKLDLQEWQ